MSASAPRTRSRSFAHCAIVLAPFQVEGELAGTVGVLGPTLMDYRRTIGAVAVVSQQLGRLHAWIERAP